MKRNEKITKNIPPGKRVKVYPGPLNDETLEPIETLMLDDPINIPIAAQYTSLGNSSSFMRSVASELLAMLPGADTWIGQSVRGLVGGLNTRLGFQVYSSPQPITITASCSLVAITDAWEEVVNPVRRLQKLVLPKEASKGGWLVDYPGIDPIVALSGGKETSDQSFKDSSVRIGRFGFNHTLFKNVDVTFSDEVDQTGFPISAKVQLTFDTCFFATQNMLDDELYRCTEDGVLKESTTPIVHSSSNSPDVLEFLGGTMQ